MIDIRVSVYKKKIDAYSPDIINVYPEQPVKCQGCAVLADRAGLPGDAALKRAIALALSEIGFTITTLDMIGP
jgi:hypothetical protein